MNEENKSLIDEMKAEIPEINSIDIRTVPPLTLAYIGDSIMDLFVRTYYATSTHEVVSKLNNRSVKIVNAAAQAKILGLWEEILTDEEKDIVRRGRNAKSATMPKHADVTDYRLATGCESLLGFLFIMGRTKRICELFAVAKNSFDELSK